MAGKVSITQYTKKKLNFDIFKGLLNSLCTAAVVMAWTAIFIAVLFLILKLLNLLKVSKEEELRGIKY